MTDTVIEVVTGIVYGLLLLLFWSAYLINILELQKIPEDRMSIRTTYVTVGVSCFCWWMFLGGIRV